MEFDQVVEGLGTAVESAGVIVIVMGMIAATIVAGTGLARRQRAVYRSYRQQVGRSILLGLEFLVAGDIIRTIAIEPTFRSVGVLAAIVLIRTFLSFSLELEITGRWPWQPRTEPDAPPAAGSDR